MKDIVIFDIDGTLANGEHRQHFIRETRGPGKKNWPKYMASMHLDTVHEHVKTMYTQLVSATKLQVEIQEGTGIALSSKTVPAFEVYIVSGRDEPYREVTEKWLSDNGITGYKALYMRPKEDYRSDDIVKEEIFVKQFLHKADRVLCVFDDRPRVIRMWRRIGVPVFDCGLGIEF